MRLQTILGLMGRPHIRLHMSLMRLLKSVHRTAWIAAACKHELLPLLQEPRDVGEVAAHFGVGAERHEQLRAWLQHGVLLGELRLEEDRYVNRSFATRQLAQATAAVSAAFAEALVAVHHEGIYGTLDHLAEGRRLADLDHDLVARVSELTAPLLEEILDVQLPAGIARHLELGCGHGRYLRHALHENPALTAVGIDLDPEVANEARRRLAEAGLAERCEIITGDLQHVEIPGEFHSISLFNLIYYLPPASRAEAIQRLAPHLAPGGRLILTSMCRGGQIGSNVLDVWFSSLVECGPLPTIDQLMEMMDAAGLVDVTSKRIFPGETYYLVTASQPEG